MLNQVNLNTNNAFTAELQNTNKPNENSQKSNLLSIEDNDFDTISIQNDKSTTKQKKKTTTPIWLKAIYSALITTAAVLGVGFLTTRLGYTPIKTNTKGLYNSRTTEFKNGAKDAIGGINSIMTINSHCGKKSLKHIPSSHQGLIVVMDRKDKKGIKTLAQSKFKGNIIYGGEFKLKQLKDLDKVKEYVKNLASTIKSKGSYQNITFASENSRGANVLNAVLKAHAENKKAVSKDFVEGGLPSHYFMGTNGIDSEKLDEAIWEGWCQGFNIKNKTKPQQKLKPKNKIKETQSKNNNPTIDEENIEKVPTCRDKITSIGKTCSDFIIKTYNSFSSWLKNFFNKPKK